MAKKSLQRKSDPVQEVFLNLAYVRGNEDLFIAMLVTVAGLGLVPTCALSDRSPLQFHRALETIARCRFSIHDLSVLGADGEKPRTAHLNMPFELGVAVAASRTATHDWFILGREKQRIERALSDIKTVTIHEHDGSGESAVAAVSHALYRDGKRKVELPQLIDAYTEVRATWSRIRSREKYGTPFHASAFDELLAVAQDATEYYVAPLQA